MDVNVHRATTCSRATRDVHRATIWMCIELQLAHCMDGLYGCMCVALYGCA
jgi:hypothetical protein